MQDYMLNWEFQLRTKHISQLNMDDINQSEKNGN